MSRSLTVAVLASGVSAALVVSSGDDEADPEGMVTGGCTALLGEGCPEYVEP